MKLVKVLLPLAAVGLIMGTASARDIDGFYGKVEQMPTAENPAWVIGGKTFKVDQRTRSNIVVTRRSALVPALRLTVISIAKAISSFPKLNRNATIAAVNS